VQCYQTRALVVLVKLINELVYQGSGWLAEVALYKWPVVVNMDFNSDALGTRYP